MCYKFPIICFTNVMFHEMILNFVPLTNLNDLQRFDYMSIMIFQIGYTNLFRLPLMNLINFWRTVLSSIDFD